MKKIAILLFFTVVTNLFSQNGKIYLKNSKFKVGAENTYVYEPPQGLILPNHTKANLMYQSTDDILSETVPVLKKGKQYEFTIKLQDSARVLFATLSDVEKIVDNNDEKGYAVLLKTQNSTELAKTLANEISSRISAYYGLGLKKIDINPETTVKDYENLFAKYPALKKDKCYINYLYERDIYTKKQSTDDFLAFAKICLKNNTEDYLMIAYSIYSRNNMPTEKENLAKELLERYPNGKLAKRNFIESFYAHKEKTADYCLETIKTLETKYNDSSKRTLITVYHSLMTAYLENKDFESAKKIESHLYSPAGFYNQVAWTWSGGNINSPVDDLELTAKISKRSLDIINKNKKENFSFEYKNQFNMYADTYALLLYKQGKYEDAFKYQDSVRMFNGLDDGGKERYLAMMDKVKSKEEVRKYIENEINTGTVSSPFSVIKLKEIYVTENLSIDNFEKLKVKADELLKEKAAKDLIEKFGSTTASDFTLKNLQGKEIKLSDYKGKIVVLDFWATWCAPCKASFPKMQDLVQKYKDKNVEFLFVNTWEQGKEEDVYKNVNKYITEKKFDFNVVFDSKQEVVGNYKIKAIPTRILIGKNGNILFSDNSNASLGELIDEQLK